MTLPRDSAHFPLTCGFLPWTKHFIHTLSKLNSPQAVPWFAAPVAQAALVHWATDSWQRLRAVYDPCFFQTQLSVDSASSSHGQEEPVPPSSDLSCSPCLRRCLRQSCEWPVYSFLKDSQNGPNLSLPCMMCCSSCQGKSSIGC